MTKRGRKSLTRWERKERLGYGGVKRIAARAGVDQSLVSRVVHGKKRHHAIEQLIETEIGRPGEEVFPPRQRAA